MVNRYGAEHRSDLLWYDPEFLVLVKRKSHELFDERVHDPLDEATVLSIQANGVIEPVIVRLNGTRKLLASEVGKYDAFKDLRAGEAVPCVEVVAGRQRVVNAREANRRNVERSAKAAKILVPATARSEADPVELMGLMIAENEVRRADSVVPRARKMQRYFELTGKRLEKVAIAFGCSEATVRNMLDLAACHRDVLLAVSEKRIGAILVAKELKNVANADQPAVLRKLLATGITRGTGARMVLRAAKANPEVPASSAEQTSTAASGTDTPDLHGGEGGTPATQGLPSASGAAAKSEPVVSMRPRRLLKRWAFGLHETMNELQRSAGESPSEAQLATMRELRVAHDVVAFALGTDGSLDAYPSLREVLETYVLRDGPVRPFKAVANT